VVRDRLHFSASTDRRAMATILCLQTHFQQLESGQQLPKPKSECWFDDMKTLILWSLDCVGLAVPSEL